MINQINSHADPPLVSCIIIFFNGETYLAEAINSVLAQTYHHWELLLVNDGSTDSSEAIARQYVEKYTDQIFYLEHPQGENRGMSATRNLGINYARGEYIAFLDADDVWLPEKLDRQLATFQQYPQVDLVCGPTQYWYSWDGNPKNVFPDSIRHVSPQYDVIFQPPTLLTLLLQNQANTPATCSVLIRSNIFKQVGKFAEKFTGMFEDQAFFAKVYLYGSIFVAKEYYDRYRQHSDNCTAVAKKQGEYDPEQINSSHFKFLRWLEQYLTEQNVENAEVWQALKARLWEYEYPILYYFSHPRFIARQIIRKLLPEEIRQKLWIKYYEFHKNKS